MKSLFDHAREKILEQEQPLAARMRPRQLDEFIGQGHILAPGRLLRRAIQADQLSSLLFYGPPGTGKTTLAAVIANTTRSHFEILNAVLAGKADIVRVTEEAQRRLGEYARRTILFVDEVHRWNKAQQDGLLPWVENGTIILIGATTENPYFTVNRALVSRSRVFQLKPLTSDDLRQIAAQALADPERGFGRRQVRLQADALDHLVGVASGDARALLNALELAIETTPAKADGTIDIDMAVAEESIQQRAVLYDKEGDYHFDIISAFIKSLRGSDPDAAVYWLAKMVYAGEDPRFLFRRMVIFAAEDVGLADPQALNLVVAAAEAFDRVGMPEGRYHLGMAALYLATAPKSNSVFAFFDALAAVEREADGEVPNHLRDASRDQESFGHGKGYLYPHAYRDHWVAQQYLPASLQGRLFYQPGERGHEATLADQVRRRREVQLAAILENPAGTAAEVLTFSPVDRALDSWLERSNGNTAEHLERVRNQLFKLAACQRHHLVLVLQADSGLLVWEAVRQVPEGGVWAQLGSDEARQRLASQAANLPPLRMPHLLVAPPGWSPASQAELANVRFDRIVGRQAVTTSGEPAARFASLATALADGGQIVLAEVVPSAGQRLHSLLPLDLLPADLRQLVVDLEEEQYGPDGDPRLNWQADDLQRWAAAAGLSQTTLTCQPMDSPVTITDSLLQRWFGTASTPATPSYGERLAARIGAPAVAQLAAATRAKFRGRSLPWRSTVAFLAASR